MKKFLLLGFCSLFIFACHTTSITQKDNRVYSSITERLQSYPGIQITGNDNNGSIRLTGMGTQTTQISDTSPLFVVNGQQVGRSLSGLANILNPNDIKRVKILRSADQTSFYGINGSNGVIEITTKQ